MERQTHTYTHTYTPIATRKVRGISLSHVDPVSHGSRHPSCTFDSFTLDRARGTLPPSANEIRFVVPPGLLLQDTRLCVRKRDRDRDEKLGSKTNEVLHGPDRGNRTVWRTYGYLESGRWSPDLIQVHSERPYRWTLRRAHERKRKGENGSGRIGDEYVCMYVHGAVLDSFVYTTLD